MTYAWQVFIYPLNFLADISQIKANCTDLTLLRWWWCLISRCARSDICSCYTGGFGSFHVARSLFMFIYTPFHFFSAYTTLQHEEKHSSTIQSCWRKHLVRRCEFWNEYYDVCISRHRDWTFRMNELLIGNGAAHCIDHQFIEAETL